MFKFGVAVFVVCLAFLTGGYTYYRYSLNLNLVAETSCLEYNTLDFYDQSGEVLLWQNIEGNICYPITLDEVSPYFIDGLISIEDKDFFEHPGFKFTSMGRALYNNLRGRPLQGGSTITQQYVKTAILKDQERDFDRKIKEAILVPEIESLHTKEKILTAYLNTLFFGVNYTGIEAASRGLFDKKSADLTLDEAAYLVPVIQSPSVIWDNPESHLRKRNIVLREMLEDDKITQKEHDRALAVDTRRKIDPKALIATTAGQSLAPSFTSAAKKNFIAILCANRQNCQQPYRGYYKIRTTFNLETQKDIQDILKQVSQQTPNLFYEDAAVIILNRSQQIEAWAGIGGAKQAAKQTDRLAQNIYPQDLWTPIIYASLLEHNQKTDYNRFFQGLSNNQRDRLQAAQAAGINHLNITARNLGLPVSPVGFKCHQQCWISRAGGRSTTMPFTDLLVAYSGLLDQGSYQNANYILEITDSGGDNLYKHVDQPIRRLQQNTSQVLSRALINSRIKPRDLRAINDSKFLTTYFEEFQRHYAIAHADNWTIGLYVGNSTAKEVNETPSALEFQVEVISQLFDKLSSLKN